MKTAAIIAEYNPFHNGHKYQIEETRRLTGADFILVLMSGDFVQRGAPAIFNKYLRTRMALLGGADVVLELPSLYALSSAEFFAGGGVSLLNALGVVDCLSFGSECGDIRLLENAAQFLLTEPESYRLLLSSFLKQGMSFPAARGKALLRSARDTFLPGENPEAFLSSPNNILALEYCKALLALHSSIRPVTVKRTGSGYHDTALSDDGSLYDSASAIRYAIEHANAAQLRNASQLQDATQLRNAAQLQDALQLQGTSQLQDALQLQDDVQFLSADDFSSLLHYNLLTQCQNGFAQYLDCGSELSARIIRYLPDFTDFTGFCALLKSKNLTFTRISRALIHILLYMTTPEEYLQPVKDRKLPVPYARLLGFRRESAKLLSSIKKHSDIPLISKPADAGNILSESGLAMLKQDMLAANIYESVFSQKYQKKLPVNEYRQSPVIL